MIINCLFSVIKALFKLKLLGKKTPLAIGWSLTYRCNQRCLYCGTWKNECSELSTSEIFNVIDELKELGTKWVSLTGGEPLLRDDLGKIIKYLKDNDIYASLSSNGHLVSQKIKDLKGIDVIKLSLDGPASIHDNIRGKGSFEKVINAIEACKREFIPVHIGCVISKYNLDCIDYLIKLALEYKLKIYFQPATQHLLRYNVINNPIAPPEKEYKQVINRLIELKKRKLPIYNSLASLRYIYHYPNVAKIKCFAGKLGFRIEPDATILACDRFCFPKYQLKKEKLNIKEQLLQMPPSRGCKQCWCSITADFNLMFSFNLNAIKDFLITNIKI